LSGFFTEFDNEFDIKDFAKKTEQGKTDFSAIEMIKALYHSNGLNYKAKLSNQLTWNLFV